MSKRVKDEDLRKVSGGADAATTDGRPVGAKPAPVPSGVEKAEGPEQINPNEGGPGRMGQND